MNKYTVIGPGNVGITLSLYLQKKGILDKLIYNSDTSRRRAMDNGVEESKLSDSISTEFNSDVILICVQDKKIEEITNHLAKKKLDGMIIIHTSGLKSYKVLSKLSKNNIIAAAHPYQTFYNQQPEILNNIAWGISCEQVNFPEISSVIEVFDGKCRYLDDDKKAVYHASAVAASNYMNLLFDISSSLLDEADMESSDFLPPIMQTTLVNNIKLLNDENIALTGPVIRKDFGTIQSHIESMKDKDTRKAYCNMGISLVLAAKKSGILNESETNKFISVFEKGIK